MKDEEREAKDRERSFAGATLWRSLRTMHMKMTDRQVSCVNWESMVCAHHVTTTHDTNKTKCAQCIQQSVQARVPPLELCPKADVYAQIDGGIDGIYQFPQIDLLKDLVFGYPNATFLLTFRRMDSWYQSISRWPPQHDIPYLKERLLVTNSTGVKYLGVGSMQDFTNFFCKHVRRVRAIVPPNRLVEIDIEDSSTGERMADIFAIDKRLWGRTNVNTKLHLEAKKKRKKNKIVWRRKKKKAKKN